MEFSKISLVRNRVSMRNKEQATQFIKNICGILQIEAARHAVA
jgi:hypothetical protein